MIKPSEILEKVSKDKTDRLNQLENKIDEALTSGLERSGSNIWIWVNMSISFQEKEYLISKYSPYWIVEYYSDNDGSGLKFFARKTK